MIIKKWRMQMGPPGGSAGCKHPGCKPCAPPVLPPCPPVPPCAPSQTLVLPFPCSPPGASSMGLGGNSPRCGMWDTGTGRVGATETPPLLLPAINTRWAQLWLRSETGAGGEAAARESDRGRGERGAGLAPWPPVPQGSGGLGLSPCPPQGHTDRGAPLGGHASPRHGCARGCSAPLPSTGSARGGLLRGKFSSRDTPG